MAFVSRAGLVYCKETVRQGYESKEAKMAKLRQIVGLTGPFGANAGRWAVIGSVSMTLAACSSLLPSTSPGPVAVYGAHHCYRTLAQVDCHAAPLAGEANRLMGHYEAPSDLGG